MSLRIFSICPEHQSHVRLWLKTELVAMPIMWVMGLIGSLLQQLAFSRLLTVEKSKLFSSPEPKAPGELIGWEGSVVRRPSSVVVVRPQFQTTSPLKLLGQL